MISSLFPLEIINVLLPDPNTFIRIAASVLAAAAAAAAVTSNDVKTLLANGLNTFLIKGNPNFSNGPKRLPKSPPDCTISGNWIFDNFILADETFAKALRSFKTSVLVNNNLCGKIFSSLESSITFDESFKVTSVPLFIPNFNLLSC